MKFTDNKRNRNIFISRNCWKQNVYKKCRLVIFRLPINADNADIKLVSVMEHIIFNVYHSCGMCVLDNHECRTHFYIIQ